MRIKTVTIENFRTIDQLSIDFLDITTFIGPNGAGKSTILKALDWFFNGTKKSALTDNDCTFGNTAANVTVRVTFDSLTPEDRNALGSYTPPGTTTFTAWKTRTPDGEETITANGHGYPKFTDIKTASSVAEMRELYKNVRTDEPELQLPAATTKAQILEALQVWESQNIERLVDVPEVQTNLFGFNSNARLAGIFDFVLVTADLRASEEAIDNKSSIIGLIIERSLDRTAANARIENILAESHRQQKAIFDEAFGDKLAQINNRLNSIVETYSHGREIVVSPAEIDFRTPSTTFSVTVNDGDATTEIDRQGHGFQRTMLISALQLLAESSPTSMNGTICLAIEEPELYQHPTQAFTFAKVLRSLAEDRSRNIQVTYATHSPFFIESRHFDEIRRLTRNAQSRPCVTIESATVQDVVEATNPHVKESTVVSQLDSTIANRLSEAMFAERALLVEGTTDAAILYGLGDRISTGSCEASGLSIVNVGGKQNIILAHAILTALGIPTSALFDGDRQHQLKDRTSASKKAKENEVNTKKTNKRLLAYFNRPEEEFPDTLIKPPVAYFAKHIEDYIDSNWPEWRIELNRIGEETGIDVAKNADAYRSATARAGGTPPTELVDLLGLPASN